MTKKSKISKLLKILPQLCILLPVFEGYKVRKVLGKQTGYTYTFFEEKSAILFAEEYQNDHKIVEKSKMLQLWAFL